MAARKSWDQLSPDYRKRLERSGVTRETHGMLSLKAARGKGLNTPTGRRREAARRQRELEQALKGPARGRKTSNREAAERRMTDILRGFEEREGRLGYLPPSAFSGRNGWLNQLGPVRLNAVISWQEARKQAFEEIRGSNPRSLAGKQRKRSIIGYDTMGPDGFKHHVTGSFSRDYPTLEDYVKDTMGPDAWDEFFREWWDDVKDLIQFSYYH